MEKAIQKAIEGGWNAFDLCHKACVTPASFQINGDLIEFFEDEYKDEGVVEFDIEKCFLDPLFWQALGKSFGWEEMYCTSGDGCEYPWGSGMHEYGCNWTGKNEWKEQWHSFIDHLAEGKSAESFFETLLT
jgi:hypothetical protein